MTAPSFPDHFSGHATDYARYRPDYPAALFDWLAAAAPARRRAWDCATGSGQAAAPLAARFERVIATDASVPQLRQARRMPRITYAAATSEAAPLAPESADLVTVAQALHWFDRPRFWAEVSRVLAPAGVIGVWTYNFLAVSADVDRVLYRLYREIVGPYWPPERALVEAGYASIEFPFEEGDLSPPPFRMEKTWTLADLEGYVRTWSAVRRYAEAVGEDPLRLVAPELARAWGNPAAPRLVSWPLELRAGRKTRAG